MLRVGEVVVENGLCGEEIVLDEELGFVFGILELGAELGFFDSEELVFVFSVIKGLEERKKFEEEIWFFHLSKILHRESGFK